MRSITSILRISRVLAAAILLAMPSVPVQAGLKNAPAAINKERPGGNLKLPMYFEANRGQTDASVKFFTRAAGYNLYLTGSEAVTVIPRVKTDAATGPLVVRMRLKGANPSPAVRGLNLLPGRTSYFFGNDSSRWQTGVEQYAKVKFGQVYPGIDMVYRFEQGHVEYDFIVAPGANPGRILMGFEGGKGLRLEPNGNLVLLVEGGELTYKAPKLYQRLGAKQVPVKGRFVLASNKNVRFEVGNYIKSKELVIDPEISYSTYLGGNDDDAINGLALDSLGEVYVTGWSISPMSGAAGFPPATTTDPTPATTGAGVGREVFVAKLSADGATLRWLAWMGGALADEAKAIALEKTASASPKIYITGVTASPTFPVFGPALQVCTGITGDGLTTQAFVAELSQTGSPATPALIYSTCWGGTAAPGKTSGNAIAVDLNGAAYVTGTTFASNFTISAGIPPPYNTFGGSEDAFVVKIPEGATGGAVSYSMLLGPDSGITNGNAIAVDTAGYAWVTGKTTSGSWPATDGGGLGVFNHHFASAILGASDAFVVKVKTDGTGLDYATYINGDNNESGIAIALNHGGVWPYHVFVAGDTDSDTDFPSTAYYALTPPTRGPVWQKDIVGGAQYHPFVIRLNPDEPQVVDPANPLEMVYATHLGSPNASIDHVLALALDSRDDAYITGYTFGIAWVTDATQDYLTDCTGACVMINPVGGASGSAQSNTSTAQDGFVVAVGSTGLTQPFMSYLGASAGTPDRQAASAIAIDAEHNIYVAGYTPSMNFPLTTGSLMDGSGGAKSINRNATAGKMDGYIMKIAPVLSFGAPLAISTPTISIDRPLNNGFYNYTSTTALISYWDTGGPGLSTGTLIVKLDNVVLSTTVITVYASSAAVQLTGLSQSTHTLFASIEDLSVPAQLATTTNTFTVDLTSATITIIQPADNSFMNYTSTMVIVTYGDTGGSALSTATLVIKLDNVALSTSTFTRYASSATVQLTGLSQSTHTLDASIEDYAGNVSTAVQTGFTVDLSSAGITIVQPADNSFFNYTSTTVVISYPDNGGAGFSTATLIIKLDNVALSTSAFTRYASSATVQLTGLAQSTHTLDASIEDYASNLSTAAQTVFTVDLASTTISIAQPADNSIINYTSATALVNYTDTGGSGLNLGSLVIRLDGTPVAATAWASSGTANLAGLAGGVHTVNASISDNAGNETQAVQFSFTVLASAACGEDFFFPSPVKGATGQFAYCMALAGTAKIRVYNVIGDLVAKLEDARAAGAQLSLLNTARLAPGVYLYRIEKDYGGGNSTTSKVKKFVVKH